LFATQPPYKSYDTESKFLDRHFVQLFLERGGENKQFAPQDTMRFIIYAHLCYEVNQKTLFCYPVYYNGVYAIAQEHLGVSN